MATSKQDMDLTTSLTIVRDTDADGTAEANVNSGAAVLHLLQVDNTGNASAASYLKIYDATSATVGTTEPDVVIRVPGGATLKLAIPQGLSFATGITFACVTAGGTGGTTSPSSDVGVVMVIE